MVLIQGTTEFETEGRTAVAVGKFDGIHKGHKKLLEEVVSCQKEGLLAVVFTFDLSFSSFLQKTQQKELTTKEEKRAIFEQMGIDILIEFPLTETTAAITPENFIIEILVQKLHAKKIVAGSDVTFGYKGAGNASLLKKMEEQFGYEVSFIEKVCYERQEISSSYVREEVKKGRMQLVTKLLGYPYSISGIIQHGSKIGRTIGMPTVNLIPDEDKLLPPNGVYFAKIIYNGEEFNGITNIGCKPTVTDKLTILAETYIYDFDKDIYGNAITVQLLSYQRPEIKFDGLEALKDQMQRDKEAGRLFFKEDALRWG